MFYFLSKILFYVFMPLSLIIFGLLVSLLSKNIKYKKWGLSFSLLCIFVFGNGFLVNEGYLAWETPSVEPAKMKNTYDVGIILTGGMILNKQATPSEIFTEKTADRFIQPLRLYKMGKIKKILISGGTVDHFIMKKDVSDETRKVAQLLEELGVKKADLILETNSRNTRENAVFTAKVLKLYPQVGNKLLLFTSAYHMRRAEGCFQKAGLEVDVFPTAFRSRVDSYTLDNLLIPREKNLHEAYDLIHELVGYVVYKILGYC